jgi:DNA-binding response OmpR family regulator
MTKKILIVDSNQISKNQIQDIIDVSEFLAYHVTAADELYEYINFLEIDLVILNQNVFINEVNILKILSRLEIPVLILASIFFDNLKLETDQLDHVKIIRLPKSAKDILEIIKNSIIRKDGKHDNRYVNR